MMAGKNAAKLFELGDRGRVATEKRPPPPLDVVRSSPELQQPVEDTPEASRERCKHLYWPPACPGCGMGACEIRRVVGTDRGGYPVYGSVAELWCSCCWSVFDSDGAGGWARTTREPVRAALQQGASE